MYDKSFTDKPSQNKDFQVRLYFFIFIIIISFLVLIIRIGNIQIVKNMKYSIRSKNNRERIIRISPIRGRIISSDGKTLAYNNLSFDLYLNPEELSNDNILKQKELSYITQILTLNNDDIDKKIKNRKNRNEDILLTENLSFLNYTKIKENLDNLPGIYFKENLYRNYPNKDVLAHVLGFTGPINANELAINQKYGYEQLDHIGKNGIEKYYEDLLRGEAGQKVYQVDARMKIQREIKTKEIKPKPGNELVLTINLDLQKNVEAILADRMGTIVVLNPSNGEVLAMCSYPDYDPNIYIMQSEDNYKKQKEISLDTRGTPLINRNIQSLYPPGSIFKLITTTAILKENILPVTQMFFCNSLFRLGDRDFKCWVYPNYHSWQNLEDAIKNSCDVYFYNVGLKVGPQKIHDYATSTFYFGNLLGIDLPFEKSGYIPSPEQNKNEGKLWNMGDTLNMTIGQGDVMVTPLQIANLMSIICNRGVSYKPHILKEKRSSIDGSLIEEVKPSKIVDIKNLDSYVYNFIHTALRKVITEGTARGAYYSNPFKIAGKTGTAEVGIGQKKQTHSWFAGFGPVDYPHDQQIVVVVLIEQENNVPLKYAAPIAGMVFNSWFNKEDFIQSAKRLYYPVKESYNED